MPFISGSFSKSNQIACLELFSLHLTDGNLPVASRNIFFSTAEHRITSTIPQEKRKICLRSPVAVVYCIQNSLKSLEEMKCNPSGWLPFV